MSNIGIPYAYNCKGCFAAVICPICGEHIPNAKANPYAQHYVLKGHIKHHKPNDLNLPFYDKDIRCK